MSRQSVVKEISAQGWENEVVKMDGPVLVDFWAPWCGPCSMVSPVMDQIASEQKFAIKFVKVNVDQNPSVAVAYSIQSIPTVAILKKGKIVDATVGAQSKDALEKFIENVITHD
ncbi:MAG: thioredoxin [Candidatus Nitrosotenuis sp.]